MKKAIILLLLLSATAAFAQTGREVTASRATGVLIWPRNFMEANGITNGLNGTNGLPGLNGTNGLNGINGTNGLPGEQGQQGIPGTSGTNGLNGLPGVNGTNGLDGAGGVTLADVTNTTPIVFKGHIRASTNIYAEEDIWIGRLSGSWSLTNYIATNAAAIESKQAGTANGTNWASLATNVLTGKINTGAVTGYGWDGFSLLAADTPWINNTVGTNLAELAFTAAANKTYAYQFIMRATTTNTANGMQYQVTLPASFTANSLQAILMPSSVGAAHGGSQSGTNWLAMTTGPGPAVCVITLNGILINGANAGTVQLRARSEVSGVGATNHIGSVLLWKLMN